VTWLEIVLLIALVINIGSIVTLWYQRHNQATTRSNTRAAANTHATHPNTQQHTTFRPDFDRPVLFSPLFMVVASAIDSGMVIVNSERRVQFINIHAEELLNVHAGAVEEQGLMTLLRDYQADEMVRDVLQDNEPREMILQPVSSERTLHLRCKPFKTDENISGVILLIRDVTQISMLERARRDLVANVSHELRTPLASINLLVETLQSEPPPDVSQRMLAQMTQEIEAVIQLADELHELSKIEAGRVTLKLAPENIKKTVEHALERIRPQANRKNIHIESSVPSKHLPVLMDPQRVGQILLNLLHNAIKFTPENGLVKVRAYVIRIDEDKSDNHHQVVKDTFSLFNQTSPVTGWIESGSTETLSDDDEKSSESLNIPLAHPPGRWMLVRVCDTGIGIPMQDLTRIFERFYKVDRARSRGGTGLGLAIAKHLVEGHGGRLWADSEEGSGSTFSFTLPMA